MKTIQMTIDDELLIRVHHEIKELKMTRSAFIRASLQNYLEKLRIKKLEDKHREGYQKHPIKVDEFEIWENDRVWGDE